ncbi:toxin glutamine deamidase domain-containing protein [Streptomyces wedmorensis]|uniref:toxin glutamine deamidase domain-containing protein n=1 Tax=Streptomyces wedmorensis TaxID=43759 RepID=UPI0034455B96
MNGPAPQPQPQPRETLPGVGQIVRQLPGWLRGHRRSAVISALVGGVFGYVSNVWLIAVRYDGSNVPAGSPATSDGSFVEGALFWGLCSTVVFGVAGYWRAVGTRKFWADLRGVPGSLVGLVRGDRAAYVHLLWGAAAAMAAALVVAPSLGAMMAIGLLATLPGVLGSIIFSSVHQLWAGLVKRIAPTRRRRVAGATGLMVGLLGSAAALLVAFLVENTAAKAITAVVLAVAAVLVARFGPPPAAAAMLLLFGTALALVLLRQAPPASADDGGWGECLKDNIPWLECTGTSKVLANSGVGAAVSAVGAILGTWLGGVAATLSGPFGGGPGGGPPTGGGGTPGRAAVQPPLPGLDSGVLGAPMPPESFRWPWEPTEGEPVPAGRGEGGPLPDLPPGPEAATGEPGAQGKPAKEPTAGPPEPPATTDDRIPYTPSIRERLVQLDTETKDPAAYGALQGLIQGLDPAKGLTPQQLATLQQLEGQHAAAAQAHLGAIKTAQQKIADAGMGDLIEKMKKGRKEEQAYTDYIQSLDRVQARTGELNDLIGRLPPSQQEAANRVLTRIQEGPPGTDKEGQIRSLTRVVLQQAQGKADAAAAAAQADVENLDAIATTTRQAAAAAGMAVASSAAIGLGLATAAQVGAFSLGTAALQGAKAGYEQGGIPGALWGTTRATVPGVDTVQAVVDVVRGKGGLLDVGLAVVQDLGKAATLASLGMRNVGSATSTATPPASAPGGALPRAPGAAGPKSPAPPTPGPVHPGASRVDGQQAIGNPRDFLKDVNPLWSKQGRGFTKESLFYPDDYWDHTSKSFQPHPKARQPIPFELQEPITTRTNCPNTVIAVAAKLAGRPLPPAPPSNGMPLSEMERVFGRKFTEAPSKVTIESHLRAAGPGAQGIVYVVYPVKHPPPGAPPGSFASNQTHVFNAVNDGGKIKFLDGQTGDTASFGGVVNIKFMRVD